MTTLNRFSGGGLARRIRVGIGGWTYAPWRNNFYPEGLVQRRELEYASGRLATIEINGTYYRAQKPAVYASWRAQTPDGFVFSLKAPRAIVQRRVLAEAEAAIRAFVFGGLAELDDRLGPINWQLPPERLFDADDLDAFLALLPRRVDGLPLRHALEVRHPSFLCGEFLGLVRRHGVAAVFTDSDEYPSFADLGGDFVYARLKRSRSDIATGYAPEALGAWAARARRWAEGAEPADLPRIAAAEAADAGPRDVFLYFIGAAKERNPAAAIALQERLPWSAPAEDIF
ncbi:MAG: DUF72 domain-containing protein [Thermoanaerobaculia bacterium]